MASRNTTISVRLTQTEAKNLQKIVKRIGLPVSHVIRKALSRLGEDVASGKNIFA
jgi:antitoxin component of RelBE/YafQ-DinJ toxin-antitoxin module